MIVEAREARREPSKPLFTMGEIVRVSRGKYAARHGKIVDYWEEPGSLHCYTLRLDGRVLADFLQNEIERPSLAERL